LRIPMSKCRAFDPSALDEVGHEPKVA
jgi:hypothetical protein